MLNICRFCLNYYLEDMVLTSEEIREKVHRTLSVVIATDDAFPNQVCSVCVHKIDELYKFHLTVQNNENLLQKSLQSNNLKELYLNIRGHSGIDLDNKENVIDLIKTEEEETSFQKKTDFVISNANVQKDKVLDGYSSDDLSLSELKIKNSQLTETCKKLEDNSLVEVAARDKSYFREYTSGSEKSWKCLTCFQTFDKRDVLRKHYKSEHYATKAVAFLGSDKDFAIFNLDEEKKYKCMKCDKYFDNKRLIRRHMVTHIEDRPFVCNICGRTYKLLSEIILHGRAHSQFKPLRCSHESCMYSTAYYSALSAHEKRHKPGGFKYTCDKCGKGFNVRTWFEQHQNYHTGEKPFVCDICGSAFTMDKYLKTHRNSLHPEASNLRRHVCIHCGLSFDNRTVLNTHLKEHGISKSYLCDICGKSLTTTDHLKMHRNTHLGEKPYACSTCGKAFVKRSNLTLHTRVHSGEKPYVCSHCGKAFSQKSTLVVHTRYHTGSRPYQCSVCPKSFVSQSRLSGHQKICP